MPLEVFLNLLPREVDRLAAAADRDFAAMPGNAAPVGLVVVGGSAVHFSGRYGNLILQIGTQLDGRRHVRRGVLFRHGHENCCERVDERIRVGFLDVRLSGGGNCLGNFLRGRSREPPSDGNKTGRDEAHEKSGEPGSWSICRHRL